MLRSVFLKTLRDQRRSLLWWSLSMVGLPFVTILFYPSMANMPEINKMTEEMPEQLLRAFAGEFTDWTSPEGFLNSQLFFVLVPLLFLVLAIARGSSAIAGEEERGTLDLLLSNPLSRWRVVVEKFGAMVTATLALALAFWVGLVIGAIVVDMEISFVGMGQATLSAAILGLAFGTLALAIGSLGRSRSTSIGLSSALAVLALTAPYQLLPIFQR